MLSSFPIELIAGILRFCPPESFDEIELVCRRFYEALQLLPYVSTRDVFHRLFHGDMDVLKKECIAFDEPQVKTFIKEALESHFYKTFYEANCHDKVLCGRYLIALTIIHEKMSLHKVPSRDMEDPYKIAKGYLYNYLSSGLCRRPCVCLKHTPLCVLTYIAPLRVFDKSYIIYMMNEYGNPKTAKFLLEKYSQEIRSFPHMRHLCETLERSRNLTVQLLLGPSFQDLNVEELDEQKWTTFLLASLQNKHINLLPSQLCLWALAYNNRQIYEVLIQNPELDPSLFGCFPIFCCIKLNRENTSLILRLIQDPRVVRIQELMYFVIEENIMDAAKALLLHSEGDQLCENPRTLRLAAECGSCEMVQLLLQDPRIDPSCNNYDAYSSAISRGEVEILRVFLHDPSINTDANNQALLTSMSTYWHCDGFKFILNHPRYTSPDSHRLLFYASGSETQTFLKMLLSCPKIIPNARDGRCFLKAMRDDGLQSFRLLLEDGRIDPSFDQNRVLNELLEMMNRPQFEPRMWSPFPQMGKLLLADIRVQEELKRSQSKEDLYGLKGTVFEEYVSCL